MTDRFVPTAVAVAFDAERAFHRFSDMAAHPDGLDRGWTAHVR